MQMDFAVKTKSNRGMEILSDSTFKGSVTLSNSSVAGQGLKFVSPKGHILQLWAPDTFSNGESTNGCVLRLGFEDGGWDLSDIGFETDYIYSDYLNVDKTSRIKDLVIVSPTIRVNNSGITFPSTNGTLALTSQIPSMDGVAHVQSLPITFNVPAECTRFYVKGANSTRPYSIQLFKWNETSRESFHEFGDFVKNVDLGVVCGSEAGDGVYAVVVEKSSSFAMSSTDGYSIRIVY